MVSPALSGVSSVVFFCGRGVEGRLGGRRGWWSVVVVVVWVLGRMSVGDAGDFRFRKKNTTLGGYSR